MLNNRSAKTLSPSLGFAGILLLAALSLWLMPPQPAAATEMTVYKSPYCGCCNQWVDYLKENGFTVTVEAVEDMDSVKKRLKVPEQMASCHTGIMDGYVVEGHVPAEDLQRLLKERPPVTGISAPGMPKSSPGMAVPGDRPEEYDVFLFSEESPPSHFSTH